MAGYMIPVQIVETLCTATGQAGAEICAEICAEMAPTLNCNHEAPYAMYQTAHTLRGEGFDAGEDGTGRGTPLVPVELTIHGTDKTVRVMSYTDVAGSLRTKPPGSVENSSSTAVLHPVQPLPFDTTQLTSKANYSNPKAGDPCHPLAAQAHVPCIAFPERMSGTQCASTENLAPSMGALNPTAIAFQERGRAGGPNLEIGGELAFALTAPNGGGRAQERNILTPSMAVRRLTPRECERLQGFPDDYTAVPNRGKPAADGPRYKALGNSWAVPNVRWIGQRIKKHMKNQA